MLERLEHGLFGLGRNLEHDGIERGNLIHLLCFCLHAQHAGVERHAIAQAHNDLAGNVVNTHGAGQGEGRGPQHTQHQGGQQNHN